MKKFAIIFVFCLVAMPSFCFDNTNAATVGYWVEIYNDFSYRTTNFGEDSINVKASDFVINTLVIKGGFRFDVYRDYFDNAKEDLKLSLYFDIYGKGELLYDFLNKPWNNNVFSKNEKLGGGIRFKYEQRPPSNERGLYFSGEIFSEYIHLYKSIDTSKDVFYQDISHNDIKVGFNMWSTYEKELNKKKRDDVKSRKGDISPFFLFSEMYGDFSYHTSNFATINQEDYLILIFAPKFGITTELTGTNLHFSLKPSLYGIIEYVRDLQNNEWNKNPYSNNTKYGIGSRLIFSKPWGKKEYSEFSLNIFIEQLWADYHSRALNWDIADKDLRVGLKIWWPLGEAKYTKEIQ